MPICRSVSPGLAFCLAELTLRYSPNLKRPLREQRDRRVAKTEDRATSASLDDAPCERIQSIGLAQGPICPMFPLVARISFGFSPARSNDGSNICSNGRRTPPCLGIVQKCGCSGLLEPPPATMRLSPILQGTRPPDQAALAHRARLPGTQAGAWAGSLRRTQLAWLASPRHTDNRRVWISDASPTHGPLQKKRCDPRH